MSDRIEVCEYEDWTTDESGQWDYGVYFCTLPNGHDGPHKTKSTCGFPNPNESH